MTALVSEHGIAREVNYGLAAAMTLLAGSLDVNLMAGAGTFGPLSAGVGPTEGDVGLFLISAICL
ncbi:hypothetical protein BBP40_009435, partial [Aspergillus hancockii]